MNGHGEPVLLAGFYDPVARQNEVNERTIRELEGTSWDFDAPEDPIPVAVVPDTATQRQEKTRATYEELQLKVRNFSNPEKHFTKEYERLRQQCAKLQRELDALTRINTGEVDVQDVCQMLIGVDYMMQTLKTHVHPTGEVCQHGCHISKEVIYK